MKSPLSIQSVASVEAAANFEASHTIQWWSIVPQTPIGLARLTVNLKVFISDFGSEFRTNYQPGQTSLS